MEEKKTFIIPENDLLDLPTIPPGMSEPVKYTWTEMFLMCEKILPYLNKNRFEKLNLATPVREFTLFDELSQQVIKP